MISDELLGEVLETKCSSTEISNFVTVLCTIGNGTQYRINIHELSHKCKKWAIKQDYQIISGFSDEQFYRAIDEKAYSKVIYYIGDDVHRTYCDMYFMATTEPEAIFAACQWILNNKPKS